MDEVKKGRILLIITIVIYLTNSFVSIVQNVFEQHSFERAFYSAFGGLTRFTFECLLFMFVYKGFKWARILIIIISGIFSLASIYFLITAISAKASTFYAQLIQFIPAYSLTFIFLLFKPVRQYQAYKRTEKKEIAYIVDNRYTVGGEATTNTELPALAVPDEPTMRSAREKAGLDIENMDGLADKVNKGKTLLIAAIVINLTFKLYSLMVGMIEYYDSNLNLFVILGYCIVCAIEWFLLILIYFKGSNIARIAEMVILGIYSVICGLFFILAVFFFFDFHPSLYLAFIVSAFAFVILLSKPVRIYQLHTKTKKKKRLA